MVRVIHQHLYDGMGDTLRARSEVAVCVFPSCLAILSPERVREGWGADFRWCRSLRNAGRDVKPDLYCLLTLPPPYPPPPLQDPCAATSPQTPTAIRSFALWLRLKHTPRGLQGNLIWAWLIF